MSGPMVYLRRVSESVPAELVIVRGEACEVVSIDDITLLHLSRRAHELLPWRRIGDTLLALAGEDE